MDLSVRAEHLKRYKEIAVLLVKYGRVDLVESTLELRDTETSLRTAENVSALLSDLERLGPTFVRIGQWLSMRSDILPSAYLEGLTRFVPHPTPMEFAEVDMVMSRELGARVAKGFRSIDPVPVKVDAIGQIHNAVLRDHREVLVKVQRPGIRGRVFSDLEALQKAAEFLDRHTDFGARFRFRDMLHEFRSAFLNELDFRQEAFNTQILRDNLRLVRRLVIPAHLEGYTSPSVLTLQRFNGTMLASDPSMFAVGCDLVGAYARQIFLDGFYDVDPRIDEFYLLENGRIAMTDLGAVGTIAPKTRKALREIILAASDHLPADIARLVCSIALENSCLPKSDASLEEKISRVLDEYVDASENPAVGGELLSIAKAAAECNVKLPSEFLMAAKTLLRLDGCVRWLDPSIDVNSILRQKIAETFPDEFTPGHAEKRRTTILPGISNLDAKQDERSSAAQDVRKRDVVSVQAADRITAAVIVCALILGAGMILKNYAGADFVPVSQEGVALFAALASGGLGFVAGKRTAGKK